MRDCNGNVVPDHSGKEMDYKGDKFIEMCHKAEIIQMDWKAKKGDNVYYYYSRNLGWNKSFVTSDFINSNNEIEILEGGAGSGSSDGYYKYTSVADIKREDIVWLPSIEDLINIIRVQRTNKINDGQINMLFEDWRTEALLKMKIKIDYSIKQLWLAFVMFTLYGYNWNGEDWVKGE